MIEWITRDQTFCQLVRRLDETRGVCSAVGMWGSSAPIVAGLAAKMLRRPLLYIASHLEAADEARDDIELATGVAGELFAAWEALPGEGPASHEIAAERLRLCSILRDHAGGADGTSPPMIIAPVQGVMQPVPTREALDANSLVIASGSERDPRLLVEWLSDHKYERLDMVESPGDFAVRGGIVDVFPPGEPDPVRIEFFGDQAESIRRFDVGTQRSMRELPTVRLPGMPESTMTTEGGAAAPADRTTSLFSYLPPETIVAIDEPGEVQELGQTFLNRLERREGMFTVQSVFQRAEGLSQLHLSRFSDTPGSELFRFRIESVQRFEHKADEAVAELCELARTHAVIVYCDNDPERKRLGEMIVEAVGEIPPALRLEVGLIHQGFTWQPTRTLVVGHHEIFGRYRQRRRIRRALAARQLDTWTDLEAGDLVVHVVHGIGKFVGMKTLRKGDQGKSEEFLTLEYADRAKVHVPASQIDLVQKYVGAGPVKPHLSKLGGTRWKKTKEKVTEAIEDLAGELLRIQALREQEEGIAFPGDTEWQREFEGSFIYTETEDQLTAAGQIKGDMTRPRPMDRLLCGDVGYGKTELAMRAAFKCVEYGKQVAVLVPTTVLAEQHFQTFSERMADYPFVVRCLSRFRTPSEQKDIIARARKGQVDVLIGTHRLLSKDVRFTDLGLVVIDEEQRFGVEHKERLKRMRATVDVLTMTATPIPRTLHMSMLGLRDISSLATPPIDRRSIVTQVRHWDRQLIRDAILREMNRDGQVYFVHNLVRDIKSLAAEIKEIVPEARIVHGHGQMNEHELEKVMLRFVRHEADVLVCTTIIESGIDIPNVNTIFIDMADRFGLADLHQLRGRVGRYKHRAYCYLLLNRKRTITPAGAKRLKAIEEYSELGAGFRIAMRDLEIRGAGNLLGAEQSGHIAAVGYEMYCQLLDRAVKRMRGEEVEEAQAVHLELDVAAHIPRGYINSERQRMEIYRRLVRCRAADELRQLEADLKDAFGPYPGQVRTLLDLAEVRVRAGQWRIGSIIKKPPDLIFSVEHMGLMNDLFAGASGTVRMPDHQTLHWRLPSNYLEPPTMLTVLLRLLRKQPARSSVA
ncbi:MAG: transcription-repair coupling factor [Phycisphaerae bacterium]|nr:transcription-repair coupling factor [Phycisphaerae bacterium]